MMGVMVEARGGTLCAMDHRCVRFVKRVTCEVRKRVLFAGKRACQLQRRIHARGGEAHSPRFNSVLAFVCESVLVRMCVLCVCANAVLRIVVSATASTMEP